MPEITVTSPKGVERRFDYVLAGFPSNCGYRVLHINDIETAAGRSVRRAPPISAVHCFIAALFTASSEARRVVMSCSTQQNKCCSTRAIMEALDCYTGEPVRGNHGSGYTTRLGYVDGGIACPAGWHGKISSVY